MSTTTLLPCPFCGGIATMRGDPTDKHEHGCSIVECRVCDVAIDRYAAGDAIAAWNRRAATSPRSGAKS